MTKALRMAIAASAALAALADGAAAQLAWRTEGSPFQPPAVAPPTLPLAAGGYCVVTLRDQQQWRPGDPRYGAQFDGRQYIFAGARERDIFAAAPTSYAPVLSGDCVVAYAETGKRTAGDVKFGVVQGGRVFFLADAEARARFVAEPDRYASADVADGGRCLVSRVDAHREVAGLPETAVLAGGLRRLFAGAYEQSLYLQHPERYEPASATPMHASATTTAPTAPGGEGWQAAEAAEPAAPTPASGADAAAAGEGEEMLGSEPAMGGYCPVTIRTKGTWVRGRYDDRVEVDRLAFFTAGPTEREMFLSDPTKYIPVLGGNCPVTLVEQGQEERGSIFHAAEYQGRLFLFADAERKARFKADPAKYASVDVAADGNCVVTLAEEGKATPGYAEFEAWHDGRLYRFLGPEQRAKFLESPDKYDAHAQAEP